MMKAYRQQWFGWGAVVALVAGCGGSVDRGVDGGAAGSSGSGGSAGTGGTAGTGGAPTRCVATSDCVVLPASCCGSCGVATRGDVIVAHQDDAPAIRAEACRDVGGCPACAGTPDPTLQAICSEGRCALLDLQGSALTRCEQDADCVVRVPDCCECGADTSTERLVALRRSARGDYEQLVCQPRQACPECAAEYPPEAAALCEDGHCSFRIIHPD